MDEKGYKATITALKREIDGLEAEILALQAEGLQPLVDRMRNKVGTLRTLFLAMSTAIEELLVENTGSPDQG
jgi:hypothetical protein